MRALAELDEGARDAAARIAAVADEQVVDVEKGARLQQRLDEVEHRDGRLVEVAVDRRQRNPALAVAEAALEVCIQ